MSTYAKSSMPLVFVFFLACGSESPGGMASTPDGSTSTDAGVDGDTVVPPPDGGKGDGGVALSDGGGAGLSDGGPDGATPSALTFAFVSGRAHNGTSAVWLWHADGNRFEVVAGTDQCSSISIDKSGKFLACSRLFKSPIVVNRASGSVQQVPINPATNCEDIVISSGGSIAFCSGYARKNTFGWQLWKFAPSVGSDAVITANGLADNYVEPALHPNGSRLLASVFSAGQSGNGLSEMAFDGGAERLLLAGAGLRKATYSPSGDRIAFLKCQTLAGPNGAYQLCDVGELLSNQTTATMLTSVPSKKSAVAYAAGDTRVFFLETSASGGQSLRFVDPSSGNTGTLVSDLQDGESAVGADSLVAL